MKNASIKKVLLVGSDGNLGQDLLKLFSGKYDVISTDRGDLDITDKDKLNKKIVQINPDIIINASAYNLVDRCEEDGCEYEIAKQINGYSVGDLAEAANGIKAIFVHYSTDYVFDGSNINGYNEDSDASPINNYGKSKLLGEKLILDIAGKNDNFKYYIIRTSKLFGKPGISNLSKKSFFDIMLDLSNTKKELSVVDGELSLFTYTKDLAIETEKIINSNMNSGIYHIANSGKCTWFDGAKYLFEITMKDVSIAPVDSTKFLRSARRPECSVLLNTKLKPIRGWKDALGEYLKI